MARPAGFGALVDAVKSQLQRDADALAATLRQLNTGPGTPPVPQEQLTVLVREASDTTRIQVFNQAYGKERRRVRQEPSPRGLHPSGAAVLAPQVHGGGDQEDPQTKGQ